MKRYKAYTLRNYMEIPQVQLHLSEEERFALEVVGHVLPFKTNNYVVDQLIDWRKYESDPIYTLTFPQKDMLLPEHFDEMAAAIRSGPANRRSSSLPTRSAWSSTPTPPASSPGTYHPLKG